MRDKDKETVGILLLNLGGPDSLNAVKPFLYNLFSDREIIRLGPSFLQKPLAWLISTIRSKKTEKMYNLIRGKSPILDITMAQAKALEEALNRGSGVRGQGSVNNYSLSTIHYPLSFKVYIGMRYWNPFIKAAVENILKDGIKHLIVLSLYPHYSKATTGS
ncbi:MAG: ferrochelatase, partial [Nitrospirota bacterium]